MAIYCCGLSSGGSGWLASSWIGLQQRLNFLQGVGMLDRHAHQRNPGSCKDLIHKLIAFLAIIALVTFVIQFDPQEGTYCFRITQ
jgi:hypothetical protein